MDASRNDMVSIAKGVGILLMVIGHAGCPSWMFYFIYLFHMPLFFFLSGYCFKEKYLDDKKTFVWHRIKGLYLPFLKYNLLFIALHNLLFQLNFYNQHYSWQDVFHKIAGVVTMSETEINLGPYWFLRYLLLSAIAFLMMHSVLRKHRTILITIILSLPVFAVIANSQLIPHFPTSVIFTSLFAYSVGYLWKERTIHPSLCIIIGLFAVVAMGSVYIHSVMLIMTTRDTIPYCLLAIVGTIATMALSKLIALSTQWVKKVFIYLGNHTMVILTWHFLLFDFISLFYLEVILKRTYSTLETEGLHHQLGGLHFLVYTILGITLPLFFQWLFRMENVKRIIYHR